MVRRRYIGGEPEQPGEPGSKGQRGGEGSHRYRMRQKLVAFGDDYWIENALGSRVFFVDGKAFRLREHLGFKDMQGNELAAIQEKVMRIKDKATSWIMNMRSTRDATREQKSRRSGSGWLIPMVWISFLALMIS